MKTAVLFALLALPLVAETPKPISTITEQLAITQLHNQMVQVEKDIDRFEVEYTKNHPGWQMNIRTGEPMPIEQPKPAEPKK